jgi:hypothetical protein
LSRGGAFAGARRPQRAAAAARRGGGHRGPGARLLLALLAGALPLGAGACAKDATGLLLNVTANGALPDIATLRIDLANAAHGPWTGSYVPLNQAPEAGPPLFAFPLTLELHLPPAYTGPTEITVTAPDWTAPATAPVTLAEGHASADIVGSMQIPVDVALTAVVTVGAGADGGTDAEAQDAGGDDAAN